MINSPVIPAVSEAVEIFGKDIEGVVISIGCGRNETGESKSKIPQRQVKDHFYAFFLLCGLFFSLNGLA